MSNFAEAKPMDKAPSTDSPTFKVPDATTKSKATDSADINFGIRIFAEPETPSYFPFMRLPPEIRNKIYCIILKSPQRVQIVGRKAPRVKVQGIRIPLVKLRRHGKTTSHFGVEYGTSALVNFLTVNRQIYTEARLLLYYENTFHFNSTTVLKNFLEGLPDYYCSEIRHISVEGAVFRNPEARDAFTLLAKCKKMDDFSMKKCQFMTNIFAGSLESGLFWSIFPWLQKSAQGQSSVRLALKILSWEPNIKRNLEDFVSNDDFQKAMYNEFRRRNDTSPGHGGTQIERYDRMYGRFSQQSEAVTA